MHRVICLIALGFVVQCLAKPVSTESKEVVATTDKSSEVSHSPPGKSHEDDSKNTSAESAEKHDDNTKESVEADKKHHEDSTSHNSVHITTKHSIVTKPTVAPQTNHVSDEAAEATE